MADKIARNPAMDIIRSCALLFVISVHFFLNNGYYSQPVEGVRMVAFTFIRAFLMICVPLFMMLSGYLMMRKTVSRAYYKKIVYILIIYALASLCCVGYKVLVAGEPFGWLPFIRGFFAYTNAPYAWYVEMYIGLFLLAPLLNVLYNGLGSKRHKQVLIGTLLFLTALPYVLNIFIPDGAWFLNPTSSADYYKIVPSYWTGLYPFTYYFLGCYLREYPLPLRPRTIALLGGGVFLLDGAFNVYRSHGVKFIWGGWQQYGSLLIVAQAVLFFAFFANLKYDRFPRPLATLFRVVSELSFGAYLVSWIFDQIFYRMLNDSVGEMPRRLTYMPLIVAAVLVCSVALSALLESIYRGGAQLLSRLRLSNKE